MVKSRGSPFANRIGRSFGLVVALAARVPAQQQQWNHLGDHAADALGWSVTYVPDVDGDGVVDLLVGAPGGDHWIVGTARLFSGATRNLIREFQGDTKEDRFGRIVADLGDVDGDGVRDFAFSAPDRDVPGTPRGAIFVVSGNGTPIRTITTTVTGNQVGLAMTYVGDVDGDGVRELLYSETSGATGTYVLTSGRTGATIRSHSGGSKGDDASMGRAGDVDGDGVDDYMVCTYGFVDHVIVYSGATGGVLFNLNRYAAYVAPAGDVDLDGFADLLLSDGYQTIQVVSGATGGVKYVLKAPLSFWAAMSRAGDLDGDGAPDLAANDHGVVHLFSGATGTEFAAYAVDTQSTLYRLDATEDVDGDGVCDLLSGDPLWNSSGVLPGGAAFLTSGATGVRIGAIDGNFVKSTYGSSSTVVSDRDGDGWRDVAVVVPGGFLGTSSNLVQIVSGQDGHELSRFQSSDEFPSYALDRQIVSIGDVNGDAIPDLAVACPGDQLLGPLSNSVDLRSGADDSLITTIVPPLGTPYHLAAAAESNGAPLLAMTTSAQNVYVYDLTTLAVVTSYSTPSISDVACIGDVDHDGLVDWFVREPYSIYDPWRKTWGVVRIFSGGSAPTLLWSRFGSATNPIDFASTVGDLDGDGVDDVLISDLANQADAGKIAALSGATGTRLFGILGTQSGAHFGSHVAPLGDVNGDGVADFVVCAQDYDSGSAAKGAVFVYSGATAELLHRVDTGIANDFGVIQLANNRWHDDTTIDPDPVSDLVINFPMFDGYRGRVEMRRLDDLMVQVEPPSPFAGQSATVTARGGPAGGLVGLYALDLNGTPLGYFLALGTFAADGSFAVTGTVAPALQGSTLDVVAFAVGFQGNVVDSSITAISIQ